MKSGRNRSTDGPPFIEQGRRVGPSVVPLHRDCGIALGSRSSPNSLRRPGPLEGGTPHGSSDQTTTTKSVQSSCNPKIPVQSMNPHAIQPQHCTPHSPAQSRIQQQSQCNPEIRAQLMDRRPAIYRTSPARRTVRQPIATRLQDCTGITVLQDTGRVDPIQKTE